jgi:HD-like signal output (HDOD) protein
VLLEQWKLPSVLCETVGCHHNIAAAEEARLDAAIVHIANVVANRAELADNHDGTLPQVDPLAWELTALDESVLDSLADEAAPMFAESWAMIQPIVRHAK